VIDSLDQVEFALKVEETLKVKPSDAVQKQFEAVKLQGRKVTEIAQEIVDILTGEIAQEIGNTLKANAVE
jgi:hypothetical protein